MPSRRLPAEPVGVPLGSIPLDVVVIGASTGGPPTVEQLLRELPSDFRAPVAICQHMPPGFTHTWAERLDSVCRLRVKEARYGEPFVAGTVYVAPTGKHMRVLREDREAKIALDMDFADSLHVPSIDILMSSVAHAFGSRALGVLLTGLGQDGALGLLALRRAGGHTIAETEDSAVAYSMPGSAVELGAAAEEVAAADLPAVVMERVLGVM